MTTATSERDANRVARVAGGPAEHPADADQRTRELKQRTRELEQRTQELEQRTRELEHAVSQLESFSYSVSHDLRAPLRAISGFAQILARRHRDELDVDARRYMDNIVEASAQMGRLIDDMLAYSRLGHVPPVMKPVALSDVFAQVMRSLEARVAEVGAEVSLPAALPTVLGDRTLLVQTFTNLLENALKYRRSDHAPRIGVAAITHGTSSVISVADNGIGIDSQYFEKIFEVFQRLHSQDAYPGTGIGLAVVKKALELQGGSVSVESRPGRGTTFRVALPTTPKADS